VDLPVKLIDDPVTSVIRGIGIILEDLNGFKDLLINIARENPPL
jgi:actin-like ATPase involved in cell morphogenesis